MPVPAPKLSHDYGVVNPATLTEGIINRDLARILREASKEAHSMIGQNLLKGTFSGKVTAAQMQQAVAGLGSLATDLWTDTGTVVRKGIFDAAQLAADQALDLDFLHGMPGNVVVQMGQAVSWNAAVGAENIISRRTAGFRLADRIYANGRTTVLQVGRIVEKGLALQRGHRDIAAQVRSYFAPDVPGGAAYASKRLARTELNNAFHETSIRSHRDKPWVQGFKWSLSSSHPRADQCDTLAGRSPYTKQDIPSKPHPQCMCYVMPDMLPREQFIDELVNGQYDDYLSANGVVC